MNVPDLLEELRIPFRHAGEHHHVTKGWLGIDCPWCGEASKFKLGIHLEGRWCSCWSCGSHRLIDALHEITGRPWNELRSLLGGMEQSTLPVPGGTEARKGKLDLPRSGPLLPCHRDYLQSRRFKPDDLAHLWRISGIALSPRLAWRILIPVNYQGIPVSWTTRSVNDEASPRYINASPEQEAEPIKSLLYGQDHCRHAVIVVEGPTDVWRIGPGAVATFGVNVSPEQVRKLSKYPVRVICFDSEATAQEQAEELHYKLAAFLGKTIRVELDAEDPGSAGEKEIKLLRRYLD